MVQLPATAAIEYVAACCITRTRTITITKTKTNTKTRTKTKTGTKTKIGTITKTVRGAYARSPQVQCVYELSIGFLCLARSMVTLLVAVYSWPSRSVTDKQKTDKNKKKQTRPRSSAASRPPLPKFSRYVEVDAPDIFHPSSIWVRPLFTELGLKNPPFCHKSKRIYVALAAT